VFLTSRWKSVFDEQGLEGSAETWGRQYVQPVLHKMSEPAPYVVCLVADGDRMGRVIDQMGSASKHRMLSKALSAFADDARTIVEQQHRGILVYAGGDDVLAFVPVPEALACADRLRVRFGDAIAAATALLSADLRPTLSVGLGVGHIMDSMGDLLALGREAEREAKRDRNALAVVVDKRSGGKRSWRARWSEDPVRQLRDSVTLLAERLSSRKVYEIADVLSHLPEGDHGEPGTWARLLELEVRRSLSRVEGGGLSPEAAGLALDERDGYAAVRSAVDSWVSRLLIARTFAQAMPRPRCEEEAAG
jgi:CRISPR-associated protein Cmr2